MLVVLAVVVALGVGLGLGVAIGRSVAAARLRAVGAALGREPVGLPAAGLATELRRLERTLAAEQASTDASRAALDRLRAALDALPTGIVVADENGEIVSRNRAADRFLGVHHADALVNDAVRAHLRAALAGHAGRETLELFGPPPRTVVVSGAPVESAAGWCGALSTIADVTERARLEAMRTDFVANISHELKTPVGALALLAEALIGVDDAEVVDHLAEKMVLEAHRVARIIEDLLELSRIELGEHPSWDEIAAGLVAADAVERVRPLADYRDIKVQLHEPPAAVTVAGDIRQLVSALANLVENGVKYSDPGSVVDVSVGGDGRWAEFVVTDHGIGIPARDLDRIFERFYRVDRARSRETGGTGLGLSIVRHVATNHGGTVAVESREGVGSTFTLRIPARAARPDDRPPTEEQP